MAITYEGWYSVKKDEIVRHGGTKLIAKYKNSHGIFITAMQLS